jgi:hypothetical protein
MLKILDIYFWLFYNMYAGLKNYVAYLKLQKIFEK